MKRFEFSLDRLLKVKRQSERLAELEQQRARIAVDAVKSRLAELHEQLARMGENLNSCVGQAIAPQQWAARYEMSERIGKSIQAAEIEMAAAEQQYWDKSQERAQIATEVEALATLRQKQWDEWRQESHKIDQERLDELGMRRWLASQDGQSASV